MAWNFKLALKSLMQPLYEEFLDIHLYLLSYKGFKITDEWMPWESGNVFLLYKYTYK